LGQAELDRRLTADAHAWRDSRGRAGYLLDDKPGHPSRLERLTTTVRSRSNREEQEESYAGWLARRKSRRRAA
jgi:hypothetical protein